MICLLVDADFLEGEDTAFSILFWGSRKLQRIARSSTAAEIQQLGNSLDLLEFAKLLRHETYVSPIELRNGVFVLVLRRCRQRS